jgi:erythritol transport system substrate-binding protein
MKMIAQQSADWDQTEAFQKMQTIIQAHHDIKGVISGNDTMAVGIAAALQAAHMTHTFVVGFDGSPDAVRQIELGHMRATVLQPIAQFSKLAVQEADRYLKTHSIGKPEKQSLNCILVTKANARKVVNFQLR